MPPEDFDAAPAFVALEAAVLSPKDSIRIAITRR
jgi:hypothetical protein